MATGALPGVLPTGSGPAGLCEKRCTCPAGAITRSNSLDGEVAAIGASPRALEELMTTPAGPMSGRSGWGGDPFSAGDCCKRVGAAGYEREGELLRETALRRVREDNLSGGIFVLGP